MAAVSKHATRVLWLSVLAAAVAACGAGDPGRDLPTVSIDELRKAAPADLGAARDRPRFAGASARRGESLFGQCLVCHAVETQAAGRQGPSLHGIWGRRTASVPGFGYSAALRDADFVWTPDAMDAWIASPIRLVRGSQMSYAGLYSQRDRDDVLLYMLTDPRFAAAGRH